MKSDELGRIAAILEKRGVTVMCGKQAATKTDDDTERQFVHTLAHAIVFIVSICCL